MMLRSCIYRVYVQGRIQDLAMGGGGAKISNQARYIWVKSEASMKQLGVWGGAVSPAIFFYL